MSNTPTVDELTELAEAMQTVTGLEDAVLEAIQRLPRIEDLNELIEAMRTTIQLSAEAARHRS